MATSFRLAGPGKTARRWLAGGTAAAIVMLGFPAVGIAPASANNNLGPFEIDGNLKLDGGFDWSGFSGPGDQGLVTVQDNTSGTQDATTFNSSQEYGTGTNGWPNWDYGGGNAPDKADFGRVALWTKTVGTTVYTYVGFDRAKPQGTSKFAFELDQVKQAGLDANPVRSQGDIRFIVWDQGNGTITLTGDASNTDVGMYVWDDPDVPNKNPLSNPTQHSDYPPGGVDTDKDGSWKKITPPSVAFLGDVNNEGPVSVPDWWTSPNVTTTSGPNPTRQVGTDQFVEFGFDLGAFGALLGCPSQGYGAANLRSITGTGTTGALVDYIQAQSVNIPSQCSSLTINKWNAAGTAKLGGATFVVTPDPTPGSNAASLTVTDGGTGDADGAANGTVSIAPAKPGSYKVKETVAPLGYILVTPNETAFKDAVALQPGPVFDFYDPLGKIRWLKDYEGGLDAATGAEFQVVRTGSPTLTNAQFQALTGKASQTFTVTDNDPATDADPDLGEIQVNGLPVGTYTITETKAPVGYALDANSAVATVPATVATLADANTPNYAQRGGSNYTFQDPRLTGSLKVHKTGTTLAGATVDVPGTTFDVYRVVGTQDAVLPVVNDVKVGSVTTGADGTATISGLAWGESYYFVETSVPSPYNLSDPRWTLPVSISAQQAQDKVVQTTEVTNKITTLSTTATQSVSLGGSIKDTASLGNLPSWATGTLTFNVYGPFALSATTCTSETASVFTSTVNVSGSGVYDSASFTPTQEGRYFWVATFTPDKATADRGIRGATGACGDPGETSAVTLEKPTIDKSVTDANGADVSGGVEVGTVLKYSVTVTNEGNVPLTGPVTDTLPLGLEAPTNISDGGTFDVATHKITWAGVTLQPGASKTFTYNAKVAAAAASPELDVLVNTARWLGLQDQTRTPVKWIELSVQVQCLVDLPVVNYQVIPHNLPAGSLTSITFLDANKAVAPAATVDGQAQKLTMLPLTGQLIYPGTAVVDGTVVDWPGWTFADGKWTKDSPNPLEGIYVQAQVNPTVTSPERFYPPAADGCTPPAVPGLTKTSPTEEGSQANPTGNVVPGDTIDYTITLTNDGGTAITSDLVDTLPANVTPVDGSYSPSEPDDISGQTLTWNDVTLGAGETLVVTFKVTVNSDATAGDYPNTATWAGQSDSTMHHVLPGVPNLFKESDTQVGSEQNPTGEVVPGDTVPYQITLTNTGGETVISDLVDTLPAGVTPVTGSFSTTPDSIVGQVITWENVAVAAGETFTVTFEVTVDADVLPGDLVNTATWAGKSDSTVHKVTPAVPGLDKSSPNAVDSESNPTGNVAPGSEITYTLTLTNTGGATAVGDLVDTLPDGVTPVAGSYSPAAPDKVDGQVLTWYDVAVKSGETFVVTFKVTVDVQPDPGTFVELTNNATWLELEDSVTHFVPGPGVEIVPGLEKTANPETGSVVKVGDVITYTIKVANGGNVALTGDLVDTLPKGIEVVGNYTRDDGGKAEPDSATATTLTWKDVTVFPGEVVTFTYDIKVLDSAQDEDSLVNTAEWFGLKSATEHTVSVPTLPQTGLGMNPLTTVGWAAGLLLLGIAFLLMGRRRDEQA